MNQATIIEEPEVALPSYKTGEGILQWLGSVDHKQIGIMYMLMVALFFICGGIEAMAIRLQLAVPENTFLTPDVFNEMFTMHGTTMIFFVLMAGLIGMGTYLVPLMIGANELAFPRLNAFSFWITLMGGLLLYFSYLAGGAPNAGWFSYTPLAEANFSSTQGSDYYVLALLLAGIGSVGAGLNFVVTILQYRAPGMKFSNLPLFVWMVFLNGLLILFALPALNCALVMLLFDRLLHTQFFVLNAVGGAMLWQHIFWVFGHPEVYILIIPAFGIISEVIPVFSRKRIFGYMFVALSTVAIMLLSIGVWAHHMFATGLGVTLNSFFAGASLLIGIPTGIKIWNWILTMWGGSIRLTTAMWFCIAFLLDFTIGGLSGIAFAIVPIDWNLTDTYFVVAHIHYVFLGGTLFGMFAGIYYWFPKMSGKMLSEKLGKWSFWTFFFGFNLTFLIQHLLGLDGMPRRVFTYPDIPGFGTMNLISSIGVIFMAAGVAIFFWNMYISVRKGEDAGDDPWDAWTLEWMTTSPPQPKSFVELPPVRSARPLFDLKNPDNPDWKEDERSSKKPVWKVK